MFEKIIQQAKQSAVETFKLLWQFKWYILAYMPVILAPTHEILNPPDADDPILNYEYTRGAWNYINQEVYIGSMKNVLIELLLLFLIGTSNMRNHPLLAKFIFIFPLLVLILGTVVLIIADFL